MQRRIGFRVICGAALLVISAYHFVTATRLDAFPEYTRQTKAACVTCHVSPAGSAALTETGKAFAADPKKAVEASKAKAAEYVGSNKCKMCHSKQHKGWLETEHARAMAPLHASDDTKLGDMAKKLNVEMKGSATQNEACVVCHVTGFQAGGYPAADSTKNAGLAAVTCEACHGPGSLHISAPAAEKKKNIYRASSKICQQCHTTVTSPTFDFAEYRKRGVHAAATK